MTTTTAPAITWNLLGVARTMNGATVPASQRSEAIAAVLPKCRNGTARRLKLIATYRA
jgi:hypothetical protein